MKKPFPTDKVPRSSEDIKQEYFGLLGKTGELQYQVSIFTEELENLNGRMRELNYEMDARNRLDAEKAKEAASTTEAAPAAPTAEVKGA